MKKICFLFLFFYTWSSHGAPIDIYSPLEELPLELKFLTESLQLSQLTQPEKITLDKNIKKLDQLIGLLDREDFYFIVKSEFYKSILKIKPNYAVHKKCYNKKNLESFEKYFKSKSISSFSKRVVRSIFNDLSEIYSSSEYTSYLYRKENHLSISSNYLKLKKKLQLLLPWCGYLALTQPNEFEDQMKRPMLFLLDKIIIYSEYLLKYSKFKKLELSPTKESMSYFKLKKFDNSTKREFTQLNDYNENKSIIEILEKKETPKKNLPEKDFAKSKKKPEQWMPRKIQKLDPNYIVPKTLPKPVGGWLHSM